MEQTSIVEAEEKIAVRLISSFVGLIHARLRGNFDKAMTYESNLNSLGVYVNFSSSNGGESCHK